MDLEQHQHKSYIWEKLLYGSSFYSLVAQIFDTTFWTVNHCKNFQKILSIQAPILPNFSSLAFRIFPLLYTGCPRKNVPDFGRVFLMLKYTDITQYTYVQSGTVTEIMAREKWGLLAGPRTVLVGCQSYPLRPWVGVSYDAITADCRHWTAPRKKCAASTAYAVQCKAALRKVGRLVVRCC